MSRSMKCVVAAKRKAKGLTQEELAKKVHIKRSTLACYETDVSLPSPEVLLRLAKALDVSMEDLLAEDIQAPHRVPTHVDEGD